MIAHKTTCLSLRMSPAKLVITAIVLCLAYTSSQTLAAKKPKDRRATLVDEAIHNKDIKEAHG